MPSAGNRSDHHTSLAQKQRRGPRIASTRCPIATTGEAFADGAIIEVLQDAGDPQRLNLILRDHQTFTGRVVEHNGRLYQPPPIDATVLRALSLPTGIAPYGTARELLHRIAREVTRFTALPERFVSEVSWSSLATWFVDATESAPSLCILGSDTIAGNQLFKLMAAFCRRPLLLSDARFAGVCALPTGLQPTLLIRHAHFDRDMQRLLSAVQKPAEYVARGGRLVALHGAVVTLSEFGAEDLPAGTVIRIPVVEGHSPALRLGPQTFEKIRDFSQRQLLAYRLDNRGKVLQSQFDAPLLADPVREMARCLGACTPDDDELQAELLELLQSTNAEYLSAKSADFKILVVECLLYYSHERPGGEVFIGEVAEKVQTILVSSGDLIAVTPRRVGKIIDNLGLQTEPRNKRGYRLVLTQAVCRRIHELARQFGLLPVADGVERCKLCRSGAVDACTDAVET